MRVDQAMSSPAVTVTPETPIKEAATLLASHGFTALPVVDGNLELVGIVSEGDVALDRIPRHPRSRPAAVTPLPATTVSGVMTTQVEVTTPAEDVRALVRRMRAAGVRSMPVLRRDAVVGVVTLRDIVELLAREDDRIAADVRRTLARYADGHYRVEVRDGVAVLVDQGENREEWHTVRVLAEQVAGVQHAHVVASTVDAEPGAEKLTEPPVEPREDGRAEEVERPATPTGSRPGWTPSTRWWAV